MQSSLSECPRQFCQISENNTSDQAKVNSEFSSDSLDQVKDLNIKIVDEAGDCDLMSITEQSISEPLVQSLKTNLPLIESKTFKIDQTMTPSIIETPPMSRINQKSKNHRRMLNKDIFDKTNYLTKPHRPKQKNNAKKQNTKRNPQPSARSVD